MSFISQHLIDITSAGVSQSTTGAISTLQTSIRGLLSGYDTYLQGSYANDTAISDINDVDIIAVSTVPQFNIRAATNLFDDVRRKIETNMNYRGKVTVGHKCLTLFLDTKKADIVPAVKYFLSQNHNTYGEPIYIANGIQNYPKTHLQNGQQKNGYLRTSLKYKQVVRMMKHFVNNRDLKEIAPSFYVECLVYSYPDNWFQYDLPTILYKICTHMIDRSKFNYNFISVAGDKQIISPTEWSIVLFDSYCQVITATLPLLGYALNSNNSQDANNYYRRFFNL